MATVTGNSTTVGIGTGGTMVATKPPTALGGTSGWSYASNFGVGATQAGAVVSGTATIPVGGTKVPITGTSKVPAAALGKALGKFASKVLPGIALFGATAELLTSIGVIMRAGQNGDANLFFERRSSGGLEFQVAGNGIEGPKRTSAQAACTAYVAAGKTGPYADQDYSWNQPEPKTVFTGYVLTVGAVQYCQVRNQYQSQNDSGAPRFQIGFRDTGGVDEELPLTQDQLAEKIARESGWPDPKKLGNILAEVIKSGESIEVDTPNIVGPWGGPTTTDTKVTTKPDGTTVTTTTKVENPITYDGPKATVKPKTTTTTTTTNPDGSSKTDTTTEEDTGKESEDKTDLCKLHPEILACKEIDVPEGEIPKNTKTVTYSPEGSLGGGSCPADRALGAEYTFSYASTCSTLTSYVRPLVLAIAAWMALVIIFGIGKASE